MYNKLYTPFCIYLASRYDRYFFFTLYTLRNINISIILVLIFLEYSYNIVRISYNGNCFAFHRISDVIKKNKTMENWRKLYSGAV